MTGPSYSVLVDVGTKNLAPDGTLDRLTFRLEDYQMDGSGAADEPVLKATVTLERGQADGSFGQPEDLAHQLHVNVMPLILNGRGIDPATPLVRFALRDVRIDGDRNGQVDYGVPEEINGTTSEQHALVVTADGRAHIATLPDALNDCCIENATTRGDDDGIDGRAAQADQLLQPYAKNNIVAWVPSWSDTGVDTVVVPPDAELGLSQPLVLHATTMLSTSNAAVDLNGDNRTDRALREDHKLHLGGQHPETGRPISVENLSRGYTLEIDASDPTQDQILKDWLDPFASWVRAQMPSVTPYDSQPPKPKIKTIRT